MNAWCGFPNLLGQQHSVALHYVHAFKSVSMKLGMDRATGLSSTWLGWLERMLQAPLPLQDIAPGAPYAALNLFEPAQTPRQLLNALLVRLVYIQQHSRLYSS
jgi:hypothetical protein